MIKHADLDKILYRHNYKLLEPLSNKYFPTCFKVHSLAYNDDFAVKIVEKKANFVNEVERLTLLTHPNIIKLYEFFEEGGFGFLILEYCSKGSLENVINSKDRPNQSILNKYAIDLISAVSYMHSKKIAHLDLKPSNILVDRFGKVKICDFGLSGIFPSGISTRYVGTFIYMSPEMKKRMPYDPFQADVWSLGILIYFIECGYIPSFVTRDKDDAIIPDLGNKQFNTLIKGALVKDPAVRITIDQMQEIVEPYLAKNDAKQVKKITFATSKFAPIARSAICRNFYFAKNNVTNSFKF